MEVKGVEKNKLNILNKFFSRNTFRHCYEEGYDKIYGQVIKNISIMIQQKLIPNWLAKFIIF